MDLFGGEGLNKIGGFLKNLLPNIDASGMLPNTHGTSGVSEGKGKSPTAPATGPSPGYSDAMSKWNAATPKSQAKSSVDPLLSQLAFLQLVAPFLQQSIQQATSGLNSEADKYQSEMGGVVSNMPQSLQELYGGVVPGVSGALREQATAGAQSAAAKPEYDFMMGLVQSVREQQEQNIQNQMLIQQLQSQLGSGTGGSGDGTEAFIQAAVEEAFGKQKSGK